MLAVQPVQHLHVCTAVPTRAAAKRCHGGSISTDVDEMLMKKKTGQSLWL
jgi:hypothetical protein